MNIFKELREKKGLRAKEVAKALDIPSGFYYQFEAKRQFRRFDWLIDIIDYFRITPEYILGRETLEDATKVHHLIDLLRRLPIEDRALVIAKAEECMDLNMVIAKAEECMDGNMVMMEDAARQQGGYENEE